MPDTSFNQPYVPEQRHNNVNSLYNNHFKFDLEGLPDVTFYTQHVSVPSVLSGTMDAPNPLLALPQVGDHLKFSAFDIVFVIDAKFKNYYSLFYWMKGYGFPHDTDETLSFETTRRQQIANPRPVIREIQTTRALLSILQPDTSTIVATIHYSDVFPTSLGSLEFSTTDAEPQLLTARCTFVTSDFDIHLTQP
jgi:hypothetical protein